MRVKGTVKWWSEAKGYGFLAPEDGGKDIFCHYSAIRGSGRRDLTTGEAVEFTVAQGQKGTEARDVERAGLAVS